MARPGRLSHNSASAICASALPFAAARSYHPAAAAGSAVDAEPVLIDDAETEFGLGMAALGGERIPSPRLGEVALDADAARVEKPELRLGVDEALFGCRAAPAKGLGRLRLDRKAIRKDQLAIALGEILVDRRRGLIPLRDAAVAPPCR